MKGNRKTNQKAKKNGNRSGCFKSYGVKTPYVYLKKAEGRQLKALSPKRKKLNGFSLRI